MYFFETWLQGWISFAPKADITAEYYKTSFANVNWLSLIYMVTTIPIGFLSTWVLDTFGLRTGVSLVCFKSLIHWSTTVHQACCKIDLISGVFSKKKGKNKIKIRQDKPILRFLNRLKIVNRTTVTRKPINPNLKRE